MTRLNVTPYLKESLEDLDNGRYADAIDRMRDNRSPDSTPLSALWRAEVNLYLHNLDDAERNVSAILDQLGSYADVAGGLGPLARRARLVRAEIDYFRNAQKQAATAVREVLAASVALGDDGNLLRATFDLGRILRRKTDYASALEQLIVAKAIAQRVGLEYYGGLIDYNRAVCSYELGESKRTADLCEAAISALEQHENLRFKAVCESLYGVHIAESGDLDRATAMLNRAEAVLIDLNIHPDRLSVAYNLGRVLFLHGKYAEAEKCLARHLAPGSTGAPTLGEYYNLSLLTIALVAQGKIRESVKSAETSLKAAESVGTIEDQFDARLLLARSQALTGNEEAIQHLRELVSEADRKGPEYQRIEARVFLAHALVGESPLEADRLIRELRTWGPIESTHWLSVEFARVEHFLSRAPIHVDTQDRLVIDVRLAWPSIKIAREAAERFIFERAMDSSDGNASAAGRLIGESRYQMHHLGRILRGEAPRPSRSKAPDAASKRPRRRRSRIVYA